MSFGAKTKGLFSFHDAAKQASSAGKWRDHVFKLSDSANNWDELWDAIGERSLIEMLLYGINVPETSRLIWVGKDRNCDFSLVSLALAEVAGWTGGNVPGITNPVVIMVKPGTYEDYMELTQNYVHVFGVGNQAESVIIQNNAHHILTVDQPTSGIGFNIIKGLELYQYGADTISNVLFNPTVNPSLTALMCRECYFKRDVAGETSAGSDAMFKVNHGLFWGEDIRVEMAIAAAGVDVRTPHMFFLGDGGITGVTLRDAKLDYSTIDEVDTNSLFLTHADCTGEVSVDSSEISMVDAAADSGGTYYVLNQLSNTRARFSDSEFHAATDNAVSPDVTEMFHLAAGEILSQRNTFEFHARSGGDVFGGSGGTAYTFFDTVIGGEIGTSIPTMRGLYYNNGLFHYLDGSEVSTKELPGDFCGFWFDGTYKEFKFKHKNTADFLTYVRTLSYEDWSHFPGACAIDGTYSYRIVPPEDSYAQKVFVPGRPIYSILEDGVTKCHGIVFAAASNGTGGWNTDVAGYVPTELEGHDSQSYRYGDFSRVVVERFTVHGDFSDSADNELLKNVAKQFFIWEKGQARIVRISHRVVSKDTGANQPRVNVSVDGNKVCTSNASAGREINTAWVHTVDDIDGPVNGGNNYNKLSFGSAVEITVDANGSNKDAMDLTVEIVVVLE